MRRDWERKRRMDRERIARIRAIARAERQAAREEALRRTPEGTMALLMEHMAAQSAQLPDLLARLAAEDVPTIGRQERPEGQ